MKRLTKTVLILFIGLFVLTFFVSAARTTLKGNDLTLGNGNIQGVLDLNMTGNLIIGGNLSIGQSTSGEGFVTINGISDIIQLLVQGHSTQTSNLFVIESGTGTDLFTVDSDGDLDIIGDYINDGDRGFSGTCILVEYSGGIAIACNDA